MATCFESLPEAWLRQFVQVLPPQSKLLLRRCSKRLQEYVDEQGVGIVADGTLRAVALSMTAQHLTSLNTLQLDLYPGTSDYKWHRFNHLIQTGNQPTEGYNQFPDTKCQATLADHIQQLPLGLPELRKIAVNPFQQPDLLAAVLNSKPPRLAHIKLCDRNNQAQMTPQEVQQRCEVLLQLSELVPNLATLELDRRTYRLACDFIHTALQQPLPHLQALLLHPELYLGRVVNTSPTILQDTWEAVFQPLLSTLTRLDFGSRDLGGAGDDADVLNAITTATPGTAARTGAAGAEPGSRDGLPLLQLRCSGFDGPGADTWALSWVSSFCKLTALDITLCSAGELDCEVLGQLQQLQSLSLISFSDEFVTAAQLGPLSSCCKLTQLKLDALLVELPEAEADAGYAADGGGGVGAAAAAAEGELAMPAAAGGAATAPAAGVGLSMPAAAAGQSLRPSMRLPQLTSLQRLTAGLMCRVPLSLFAPNLTRLKDLDYDLDRLDLSDTFISDSQPTAPAGLSSLQVLAVNIFALVRHAATPNNLLGLRELHVDMVGSMDGSCIDPGGLPCLPHLTKLVMTIDTKVHHNLPKTYSTSEDVLLWRNQSSVRHLRLRGSAMLGGFLVEESLLQELPRAMPYLERAEIVKAHDLTVPTLKRFVEAGVCRCVSVQGCRDVSARDCRVLVGDVEVEFAL